MKLRYIIPLIALIWASITPASAANDFFKNMDFELNAGTNIGGASPLPLPAEIRKIESFNPQLNLQIGGTVRKWLGTENRWGVALGVRLETKGMKTAAEVKNYGMEIINNGKTLKGRWTGKVSTEYHSQQLVVPVTAVYRLNDRIIFNAGPYVSYAFSNDFNGYVHDGYLREGDPTGDKVTFSDDARASYDFDTDLRTFQWGGQLGVAWRAYRQFSINANLVWGFNDIFKSSFKTITFSMYPIYLNLGFGYTF